MTDEFRSWRLLTDSSFEELLQSIRFDDVTTGRRGAVLVGVDARGIPIVRTTTPYRAPAQRFQSIHVRLAAQIGSFNNALVEHYTSAYASMKRHSDQALDLAEGSSIAVYSCYRDPERPSRRLLVRPKAAGAAFEVPLDHDSVVAFSLETNRRFTHAIALCANAPDNDWLGITFRTSKTFVRFVDGHPALGDTRLTLATEDQRRELFQLRRRENVETGFVWPPITYTLSESDLVLPE